MTKFLTLGTAQLGLDYGINSDKKPSEEEAQEILSYAYDHGIKSFDTASAYGNSERILGNFLQTKNEGDFYVTTKIESISANKEERQKDVDEILAGRIERSLKNLRIHHIDNVLIHDFNDLVTYPKLPEHLKKLKNKGIISEIGASVYTEEQARAILEMNVFDTIQVPINVFDHRLIKSGCLDSLKSQGFKIFVRSIFLQGLLFIKPQDLPDKLKSMTSYLEKLNAITMKEKMEIGQVAFDFIKSIQPVDSIIIGVDNTFQLKENIDFFNLKQVENIDYKVLDVNDEKLIDPRFW
ncbi:MAG: aldo/keto reductase [Promethearchaeota archaeon]